MPSMPPPWLWPACSHRRPSSAASAIMASVVISSPATEAAFWIAVRTTLVGSMMPLVTHVHILAALGVVTISIPILFEDLADDHRAIVAGVDGNLPGRSPIALRTISTPVFWSEFSASHRPALCWRGAGPRRRRGEYLPRLLRGSRAWHHPRGPCAPSPRFQSRRRRGSPRRRLRAWRDAPAASHGRSPRWSPRSAP